jgi:hypothetical protein
MYTVAVGVIGLLLGLVIGWVSFTKIEMVNIVHLEDENIGIMAEGSDSKYMIVRDGNRVERVSMDDKTNEFFKSVCLKLANRVIEGKEVRKVDTKKVLSLATLTLIVGVLIGSIIDKKRS